MARRSAQLNVLVKVNELGLGGTQLNALDSAFAGREHGVNATLVGYRETLPTSGPTLLDVASERGVRIEVLDEGRRSQRRRRARDLSALADKLDVDLVHCYGAWTARQAYWGPCRLGKRPLVMTVYEMWVPPSVYRRVPLIVGTRYLLEDLETTRGNVHLISPPVDLVRDDPAWQFPARLSDLVPLNVENLHLVVVSRLSHEMKAFGIGVAIRALERLGRDDVDLIIVGDGPAEASLRAEADQVNERLGHAAVVFAGVMADPRVAYADADIVLGMGGSAARALAFARPLVVIGEHGWCRAFTPETSDALFRNSFWSDDVVEEPEERLVGEIRQLLDPATERDRIGSFGREFAEANFGLTEMTRRLVSVYDDAMTSYGRSEWLADWRSEVAQAARHMAWKVRRRG